MAGTLRIPIVSALVVGAALAAVTGSSSSRLAACVQGYQKVNGITVNRFCGPAHAKVTYGGKTYTFPRGKCDSFSGEVDVSLGDMSFLPDPQKFNSMTIHVPAHNGAAVAPAVRVGWTAPPSSLVIASPHFTLTANGKKGTFTGSYSRAGGPTLGTASGSFSCT